MQDELVIGPDGFAVLPGAFNVALCCLVVLFVTKSIGHTGRVRFHWNRQGMVLDILNLLTAGSLVASLATTPTIAALASTVSEWLRFGGELALGSILTLAVMVCAITYSRNESGWLLLLFGILTAAAASLIGWVNSFLQWWTESFVAPVFNVMFWLISKLLGLNIGIDISTIPAT